MASVRAYRKTWKLQNPCVAVTDLPMKSMTHIMILGAIAALTMLGCERHNFDDTKILHGDHGHHDEHYGDDAHHGDDHKDGDKKHDDHAKEEGQGEKKAKGKSKGEKKAKGGGKKGEKKGKSLPHQKRKGSEERYAVTVKRTIENLLTGVTYMCRVAAINA